MALLCQVLRLDGKPYLSGELEVEVQHLVIALQIVEVAPRAVGEFQLLHLPVIPAVIPPQIHDQFVVNVDGAGNELVYFRLRELFHVVVMNVHKVLVQGQQLVHLHFHVNGGRVHSGPDLHQGVDLRREA